MKRNRKIMMMRFFAIVIALGGIAASNISDMRTLLRDEDTSVVEQASWLVDEGHHDLALAVIGQEATPESRLVRGRALRMLGRLKESKKVLKKDPDDSFLLPWFLIERMALRLKEDPDKVKCSELEHLTELNVALPTDMVMALATCWRDKSPLVLLVKKDDLVALIPKRDRTASQLLQNIFGTLETPEVPRLLGGTIDDRLADAERLLDANKNRQAYDLLKVMSTQELSFEQRCVRSFALGYATRKERWYAEAETWLTQAIKECAGDEDRGRRAMYTLAKVVSIRDGLRAIPIIEAFAKKYPEHTMVDDVMFWAGDLYQRRDRFDEASKYYRLATRLKGDQCHLARWRIAWMAYTRAHYKDAAKFLGDITQGKSACAESDDEVARGLYWSGQVAERLGDRAKAAKYYKETQRLYSPNYYAQAALARWQALDPQDAMHEAVRQTALAQNADFDLPSCDHTRSSDAFMRGTALLARGLVLFAREEFRWLDVDDNDPKLNAENRCSGRDKRLLAALLQYRVRNIYDATQRIRTDFGSTFRNPPGVGQTALWRVAFPRAYPKILKKSESDNDLPPLSLLALVREESVFNREALSWAGAAGLTQLMLPTAKAVGKQSTPNMTLQQTEDLFVPETSLRLGGNYLGSLYKRYNAMLPIALAAYNAGEPSANSWVEANTGKPLDVFVENISVQETRDYVRRVSQTHGIYRWLYLNAPLALDMSPIVSNKRR